MTTKSKYTLPLIAVIAVTMVGFGTAYALTVTMDKGIGCGPKNWGIKEYQNNDSGTSVAFGYQTNCTTTNFTYHGRSNVATIETEINGSYPVNRIAWASVFQGEDPFGNIDTCTTCDNGSDTVGHASNHNSNFPEPAEESYDLKIQWIWTNELKPATTTSNIYANYLTDVWLEDTSNNVVVIDFLVDRLKNDNGNWAQDQVGNVGTTYYTPFCKVDDRGTPSTLDDLDVYHYGVIVDTNDSRAVDTWHEITPAVSTYISNAFTATYTQNGCGSNDPGVITSFDVIDQEQGIELQIFTANDDGKVKGAYSFSELWY